jgi:perosamine synthetase
MGVAQMEGLDKFVEIKRKNALRYQNLLSNINSIEFLWEKPWVKSNFWLYTIKVSTFHKKSLIDYLLSKNIQVRPMWKPIHILPMYKDCQTFRVESALNIYDTALNLPCSIGIKMEEIEFTVEKIKSYLSSRG